MDKHPCFGNFDPENSVCDRFDCSQAPECWKVFNEKKKTKKDKVKKGG